MTTAPTVPACTEPLELTRTYTAAYLAEIGADNGGGAATIADEWRDERRSCAIWTVTFRDPADGTTWQYLRSAGKTDAADIKWWSQYADLDHIVCKRAAVRRVTVDQWVEATAEGLAGAAPEPTRGAGDADVIRCAAALMRKRADEATPGPWLASALGNDMRVYATSTAWPMSAAWTTGLVTDARAMPDAMHIASWGPLPALATADLLDRVAGEIDTHRNSLRELRLGALVQPTASNPAWAAALDLARAYLRETTTTEGN